MPRPHCTRRIHALPGVVYFKPAGVPLRELEERQLTLDEYEALRLADLEGMQHAEAARRMGISRQTFGRILARARHNVASCITGGMALRINGGVVKVGTKTTARRAG